MPLQVLPRKWLIMSEIITLSTFEARECRHCHEPFMAKRENRLHVYCSSKCRKVRPSRATPRKKKKFENCGVFYAAFTGKQRYCSEKCRALFYKKRYSGNCRFCGGEFLAKSKQQFCSPACNARWRSRPSEAVVCQPVLVLPELKAIGRGGPFWCGSSYS